MSSIETSLKWFTDREGKVTYSMASRLGPSSYDCSSATYFALIAGGFFPASMRIGNTDSLFGDLEKYGWTLVPKDAQGNWLAERGDVVIWGKRGASGGANGHAMMMLDDDTDISCAYAYDGIARNNYNWFWTINGKPNETFYRFTGGVSGNINVNNPVDQVIEVGSFITFQGLYRVDDLQQIGGVWQVRTNVLCPEDFTWDDNGIPVAPLVEVTADSYATADQDLDVGSLYKIPGKYQVLDVGQFNNRWLAMISMDGMKLWVDLEPATEVGRTDPGTPTPTQKPQAPTTPPVTPTTPVDTNTQPTPEMPTTPTETGNAGNPDTTTTEPTQTQPADNNNETPKEEPKMAFSEADQKALLAQTQSVQDIATNVSSDDEVEEIVDGVSQKTKTIVYFVGDALIGLGLIVPALAVVFNAGSVTQVAALSSVLATAGTFILTMFGIYKSNK